MRSVRATFTWKLIVEYDGTRYSGWQEQRNSRTVAGELRKAAAQFLGSEDIELDGSGRTDAGVHALAQVARLKTARSVTGENLLRGINGALPKDICVLRVEKADARFHPRHDALVRYYLYQLSRRRTAFARPFVWWIRDSLDLAAMQQAASLLIGRHDFERFSDKRSGEASQIVVVEHVQLAQAGSLVLFRIGASHFLWKMVRRIVGTLVEVGRGALSASDFGLLLQSAPLPGELQRFAIAEHTAPASGLFLERVVYDEAEGEGPGELVPAIPVP